MVQFQMIPHTYEDLPDLVVNLLEPILWWLCVLAILGMAAFFFKTYKASEAGKKFIFGLFLFATMFGTARAVENIRKFSFADHPANIGLWWIDEGTAVMGLELWLRIAYYLLSWTAIAIFFFVTERQVFQSKSKFIFTVSAIWEGIVSIALYFTDGSVQIIFLIFSVVGFFIAGVGFILIYLLVAFKSTGVIRTSSFLTAFGMTFFVIGVMGELPESFFVVWLVNHQMLDAWLIAVGSPLSMLFGCMLLFFSYKKMFSELF